jgi:glucosamine kinase
MIIIVDGGSTKADWEVVYPDGSRELHSTTGFNPFFHDEKHIESLLKRELVNNLPTEQAKYICYYGAGCSDPMRCDIVNRGISTIFPNAKVEVEHDLLASARAACGEEAGIACIIGTGSNTCLYDGKDITDNVMNMGYLLGDEGSGSHLGKLLIKAWFYRELPDDIEAKVIEKYGSDKRAILNKIYGTAPNVYLASFATFYSANRTHFYIQKLVAEAFTELIDRHIIKYEGCHRLPVSFVGSIAYHFRDILKMCLEENDMRLGTVIQKPIDPLVAFHLEHLNEH